MTGRLAVRPGWQPVGTAPKRLLLSEVAGDSIAFPLSRDVSLVPGFVPALAVMRDTTRETMQDAGAASANGFGGRDGRAAEGVESEREASARSAVATAMPMSRRSASPIPNRRWPSPVAIRRWRCCKAPFSATTRP